MAETATKPKRARKKGAKTLAREYFEALGINTLYLVFPWHIPGPMADRMDAYHRDNFGWLDDGGSALPRAPRRASWHSYRFHVPKRQIPELKRQMAAVAERAVKNSSGAGVSSGPMTAKMSKTKSSRITSFHSPSTSTISCITEGLTSGSATMSPSAS